ncbi:MAG TPA: c-type cytochrome [Burkholderiaceae bacterium]
MKARLSLLSAIPIALALSGFAPAQAAVDAESAQGLMKSNKCTKCHAAEKDKSGPSLKSIASKYKGKADAEAAIIKSITTGPKVKLDDGSQEEHTIIKTKDEAALKNLAQWILMR